jgi:hypothetical protein
MGVTAGKAAPAGKAGKEEKAATGETFTFPFHRTSVDKYIPIHTPDYRDYRESEGLRELQALMGHMGPTGLERQIFRAIPAVLPTEQTGLTAGTTDTVRGAKAVKTDPADQRVDIFWRSGPATRTSGGGATSSGALGPITRPAFVTTDRRL